MGGKNSCLLPEENLKGSNSNVEKSVKNFMAGEENIEDTDFEEVCVD